MGSSGERSWDNYGLSSNVFYGSLILHGFTSQGLVYHSLVSNSLVFMA